MAPRFQHILLALLVSPACSKTSEPPTSHKPVESMAPSGTSKESADWRNDLAQNAALVLSSLATLETEGDVTCWTSFRQLDWFIAEASYGEFASLAKIRAIKGLVRGVWSTASATAKGRRISADEIRAVALPVLEKPEGFANKVDTKNYKDYQKSAEHLRVLLAVLQDEVRRESTSLRPLEAAALDALANSATVLSLALLKESGGLAKKDNSESIETRHIGAAYRALTEKYGYQQAPTAKAANTAALSALRPLTQKLIAGKAEALRTYNNASGIANDLNRIRVAKRPVNEDAAKIIVLKLMSFTRFVSAGFEPMRSDNFLSDGAFEASTLAKKAYLDDVHVQNVVQEIFPHEILKNGDVLTRFEPNPGPMMGGYKPDPFEIRMLDHQMNGVRDSSLHWAVLARVWKDAPFAMDPFAAEYLSEVVSMMATLWLIRADNRAGELGKDTIDADSLAFLSHNTYVMVPPRAHETAAWGKEQKRMKQRALRGYKSLFRDVSKGAGLPAELPAQKTQPTFNIQDFMGGGTAVGDVNDDGYPDVFLAGEGLGRLFLNRGKAAPGVFVDATEASGLPSDLEDSHAALFFDMEGDGDVDLLVARGNAPSLLFEQENGRFKNVTAAKGLRTHKGAHSATVFDYDGDGDLDIYIGYYGAKSFHAGKGKRSVPAMDGRNGSPNQLWQQQPDGRYREVAAQAGVADPGWTLAVSAFDYERDGDLDLYMANDFGANAFYRNNGDGTFTDVTGLAGMGDRGSGMNVDFTDINSDGHWDVYVTNIDMFSKRIKVVFPRDDSTISLDEPLARRFQYLSGNQFYVSDSKRKGGYSRAGIAQFEPGDRGWGWDAVFFDYDNDGDDDMYLLNGWVDGSYAGNQQNQMFVNDDAVFYKASEASGEAFAGNSRSLAAADFDLDGDVDILVNNFRQPPRMLRNENRRKNNWVALDLRMPGKNSRAVGAIVELTAGNKKVLRQVLTSRGYLSQGAPLLHAGVGTEKTVAVTVTWPDGKRTQASVPVNQVSKLTP